MGNLVCPSSKTGNEKAAKENVIMDLYKVDDSIYLFEKIK